MENSKGHAPTLVNRRQHPAPRNVGIAHEHRETDAETFQLRLLTNCRNSNHSGADRRRPQLENSPHGRRRFETECSLHLRTIYLCCLDTFSDFIWEIHHRSIPFNIFFLSLSAWAVVNSYLFSIDRSISSSYSILLVFWWVTYLVFTQSRRVVPQRTMKYYADFLFLYILVSIFAALATGEVRLPGITMKPGRNQMALFAVTLILIACYMRNIGYGNRFLNHTMILTGFLAILYSGSRTFMLFMLLIGFFTLFRRHGTFKVSDFARFSLIIVIGVLAFVGVLVLTEDLSVRPGTL